jgi:hypothetical protein
MNTSGFLIITLVLCKNGAAQRLLLKVLFYCTSNEASGKDKRLISNEARVQLENSEAGSC